MAPTPEKIEHLFSSAAMLRRSCEPLAYICTLAESRPKQEETTLTVGILYKKSGSEKRLDVEEDERGALRLDISSP